MMLNIYFQQNLCTFPTAWKYKFRGQGWFETIKCTSDPMWGAAVWSGQAALCWLANGNTSNSPALQKHVFLFFSEAPAPSANKEKISKDLNWFGVMDFIGTWKRNAIPNSKPLLPPFQHRPVGVSERDALHVCVWTGSGAHLLFYSWKIQEVIYLIFIIPSFWPSCNAFADAEGCWGCQRAAAEPPQSCLLQPWTPAMVRPSRLLVCLKSQEYLYDFFFSKYRYFSTVLCIALYLFGSASYWDLGSLLVYCSLSHFHITFYWRPGHFLGRVLDSAFFLN